LERKNKYFIGLRSDMAAREWQFNILCDKEISLILVIIFAAFREVNY